MGSAPKDPLATGVKALGLAVATGRFIYYHKDVYIKASCLNSTCLDPINTMLTGRSSEHRSPEKPALIALGRVYALALDSTDKHAFNR